MLLGLCAQLSPLHDFGKKMIGGCMDELLSEGNPQANNKALSHHKGSPLTCSAD